MLCERHCRSFIVTHPLFESVDKLSFHVCFSNSKIWTVCLILADYEHLWPSVKSAVVLGVQYFSRSEVFDSSGPMKSQWELSYSNVFSNGIEACLALWLLRMPGILCCQQRSKFPFYNVIQNKTPNCTCLPLWPFLCTICLYSKTENVGPFLINVFKEHI